MEENQAVYDPMTMEPRTIEELKLWYEAHNLPPEDVTRFFIGKDIKEPKAFGIYKNEYGEVVVYKNKDTGERVIRYQGDDEALGVSELLDRLRQEIRNQKGVLSEKEKKRAKIFACAIIAAVLAVIGLVTVLSKNNGYYRAGDDYYYYSHNTWYLYDTYYGWGPCYTDPYWEDDWRDYYVSSDYDSSYGTGDFMQSDYYYDEVKDDWDSQDDSWSSSDSWDSGSTDWGSDW